MYLEIQVALNFLISFLYNKLPRRRVNQFGEELEAALKTKFAGHWYPDEPAKGSAYRCLKTANPLDPVFEIAARNCGLELSDVQEYLPNVTIWIEPGEVSYRMSEKSPVKLLYSENEGNLESKRNVQSFNASEQVYAKENESSNYNNLNNSTTNNTNLGQNANEQPEIISNNGNGSPGSNSSNSSSADSGFNDVDITQQRKVRAFKEKGFNPEAQCFKPIDSASLITSFNNNQSATNQYSTSGSTLVNNYSFSIQNMGSNLNGFNQKSSTYSNVSNYFNNQNNSNNPLKSPSNQTSSNVLQTAGFKQTQTMTTAQFAQTKFGSTKLKTTNNSSTGAICGINGTTKRNNYSNRMSPTEFSNYIKQRALLQQQQQQQGMNNTLSQSLNGHQLQVPLSSGNNYNGNSNNGGSYNLFNSLSPQPSRSISPISNQDNFLLMAAAAAVSNGQQQTTNQVTNSLIRNQLVTNTSPISANNGIQTNSANNSICSSLSSNSNSGSTSLKLMLNNQQTNQNILSPSSAPADNLLSDINYLSELFNTSLSPTLLNSSTSLNSSLNATMNNTNSINKSNAASLNHFNGPSFLEMNSATNNSFGNFGNDFLQPLQQQNQQMNNKNLAVGSKKNEQFNQPDMNNNNQTQDNNQPQNQQNSPPKSNDKQFDSSYSMSNGIYPNQYQHLLVAN